jgi:hypothetical protein
MISDLPSIRARYLRGRFWVDLLTTVPWDCLALAAAGEAVGRTDTTARYIALLRLLRMVRPRLPGPVAVTAPGSCCAETSLHMPCLTLRLLRMVRGSAKGWRLRLRLR